MKRAAIILAAALAAISSAASAEQWLDCPMSIPGRPSGLPCVLRGEAPPSAGAADASVAYVNRGDARTLQQAQAYADQGDARTLHAAQQHTSAQVAGLQREAFAGIAQAAALVPLDPWADGETTLNLGAATYGGQTALGLSLAHQSGRVMFTGGVGTSGGKRHLVRVGLGWRF